MYSRGGTRKDTSGGHVCSVITNGVISTEPASCICLQRFLSQLRDKHQEASADKRLATYRHSIHITQHTETMDIALSLHLLLYVLAATDRRLGHHSHTLIEIGSMDWFVSRDWRRLTLWRRNYFFLILAHAVYKMWIIQEPNKLALWNNLHFEEKNTESVEHV